MKVTIYTQVYNAENYIEQCIDSVLHQTYSDFEFVLIDNGSTDRSGEILQNYARKSSKIRLIHFDENKLCPRWFPLVAESKGKYITRLDADDWWEQDYLKKLITFAEENGLDIACTGTVMHLPHNAVQRYRKVNQQMIFSKKDFADGFLRYHVFFRTSWGKLVRTDCAQTVSSSEFPELPYGLDTLWCFQLLRHANRIGIDNSILHHYRIIQKSISYQYSLSRFDSDLYLYHDTIDFLSSFGPVSSRNRKFLQCVYANAVSDTLNVLNGSSLTPLERLQQCAKIASHPLTLATYRQNMDDSVKRSRNILLQLTLQAGLSLQGRFDGGLCTVIQTLLPRCGPAVTGRNLPLVVRDQALIQPLLADDPEPMLRRLLELIAQNQGVKKYGLAEMLQALAVENPILAPITDTAFLRRYGNIYLTIWRGEQYTALEEMTGLLLENQVSSGKRTFLELYVSLAAILSEESAFVYGKLQLASLLLKQGDISACRVVVNDLEEMGLTGSGELEAIKDALEKK